jgi:hypothetical protein
MNNLMTDICKNCGKCCQCLVLPVVKPLQKALMGDWLKVRGCEIVSEDESAVYVKVDSQCPHLKKSINPVEQESGWSCEIYNERPEGCRIFDGRNVPFLDCAWKSIPKNYILEKSNLECPFCKRPGTRLRRYKQGAFWIVEYRCPNGHIFQKEN